MKFQRSCGAVSDAVPTLPCYSFFYFIYLFIFLPHLENVTWKWREINLALISSCLVTLKEDFLLSARLLRQPRCHNRNRSKLCEECEGKHLPWFYLLSVTTLLRWGFKSQQQFDFFFYFTSLLRVFFFFLAEKSLRRVLPYVYICRLRQIL